MNQVTWRFFWVVFGGAATLACGAVPVILGWPPVLVAAAALPLGVGASSIAKLLVYRSQVFADVDPRSLAIILTLVRFAIAVHVAWVVAFQFQPDWWPWWIVGLIALSGCEYGYAYTREFLAVKMPPPAKPVEVPVINQASAPVMQAREALRRSGLSAVQVGAHSEITDETGRVIGSEFELRIPSLAVQRGEVSQ